MPEIPNGGEGVDFVAILRAVYIPKLRHPVIFRHFSVRLGPDRMTKGDSWRFLTGGRTGCQVSGGNGGDGVRFQNPGGGWQEKVWRII